MQGLGDADALKERWSLPFSSLEVDKGNALPGLSQDQVHIRWPTNVSFYQIQLQSNKDFKLHTDLMDTQYDTNK